MNYQIETSNPEDQPTRWERFLAWLTVLAQSMDYDPQMATEQEVKRLRAAVALLEERVNDFDKSSLDALSTKYARSSVGG